MTSQPSQFLVGDSVPLTGPNGGAFAVRVPDGSSVTLPVGATNFTGTLQPGIYSVTSAAPPKRFAVNLDPAESRTMPLAVDQLERLGVPISNQRTPDAVRETERKAVLQSSEAESRQKLWRWLSVAALAVLLIESALAGWTARRSIPMEGTPA